MSYILDALRRADSERERGAIPGLHTQAVPVAAADAEADVRPTPWKWLIVAAFIVLLGLVAWLWFGRSEAPEPAVLSASARPPLVTPPAAVAPVAAAAPPPLAAASTPAPLGAAATAQGAPVASAPSARKPAPAVAARKPPAAAAASAPAAAKTSAKASEPEARVSALSELPEEIRRELPALAVGGSIYSKSAANRMLVINGQVFHEGDELAAGLTLEQIKQKAAVLKFKGYRYEITY